MIRAWLALVVLVVVVLGAACGDDRGDAAAGACVVPEVPPGAIEDPDHRIEDIIEHLTGERQTGDLDPVEETIDDPNFGGVWGDRAGGVVVAVLDCSLVDGATLAAMAGGSARLVLIEVNHTFREVEAFRDDLLQELRELGVEGDVGVDSTLSGRRIEITVEDRTSLPADFGSGVPADLFTVVEGEVAREGG